MISLIRENYSSEIKFMIVQNGPRFSNQDAAARVKEIEMGEKPLPSGNIIDSRYMFMCISNYMYAFKRCLTNKIK